MPNVYNREDKPSPENRPVGPKRSKFSLWTIIAILIVLAFVFWLFGFTFGEVEAAAEKVFSPASPAAVLTG